MGQGDPAGLLLAADQNAELAEGEGKIPLERKSADHQGQGQGQGRRQEYFFMLQPAPQAQPADQQQGNGHDDPQHPEGEREEMGEKPGAGKFGRGMAEQHDDAGRRGDRQAKDLQAGQHQEAPGGDQRFLGAPFAAGFLRRLSGFALGWYRDRRFCLLGGGLFFGRYGVFWVCWWHGMNRKTLCWE